MGRGIPPAYVFAVLADRILIGGNAAALYRELVAGGLKERVVRETPSTLAVRFAPEGETGGVNPAMAATFRWLCDHGVLVAEHRDPERSVARLAAGLQRARHLARRVAVITWLGPDEWRVSDQVVDPPDPRPLRLC